jgi:hypothetical protein
MPTSRRTRRSTPLAVLSVTVTAAVLLAGGCGTQHAGAGAGGADGGGSADAGCAASPSAGTEPGAAEPGGTAPEGAQPGGTSADGASSGETELDGVRITGVTGPACEVVEWEVTNSGTRALTYTVVFSLRSPTGAAMDSREETVPSVAPGTTVRRTLDHAALSLSAGTPAARIVQVRSVPADEAPSTGGPCPESGVRVYTDRGDAAMGLRVVGLRLENCGTGTYRLEGYPRLELLDEEHEPVEGVRVLRGGSAISTGTGADAPPLPLALKPGERAHATLVWRNTTESGEPVHAAYVRTWAKPGADPVMVTPELDLGTTGKLGVGAWQKEQSAPPAGAGGARPGEGP